MDITRTIIIDREACTACGLCADVCPVPIIEKDYNNRVFKDRPVPRKLLEKIVQAIAFAPPGFPPLKTELVVVEDSEVIRRALPGIIAFYENLAAAMKNPVSRFFIRRKAGASAFKTLETHVIPMMKSRLPDLKRGVSDTITRNAQAMILFHAARDAENYETDAYIALTYGLLIAHELGLGATATDFIPPAVEHSPALRRIFSIPKENVVVSSMILGYPRYRHLQGITCDLKRATRLQARSDIPSDNSLL